MGYFISNQHFNKGLDPYIHVIDEIYNIKCRSTLHALVANYTNKYVTFNKGQCIGHIKQSTDHMPQTSINSLTMQMMTDEHFPLDTLTPTLYTLPGDVRKSLYQLLETFKSQFVQDETSIGTTHLTKMQINTGNSEPVSQRTCPIAMKHNDWVQSEINKLCDAQVICSSNSSWSAPVIVVSKGDGRKCLVIDYRAPDTVIQNLMWPMSRVEDISSKLNCSKYFSMLHLCPGYHHIPLNEDSILKNGFTSPFGKYKYLKAPFWTGTSTSILQRTNE